jgi:hypothetical protein
MRKLMMGLAAAALVSMVPMSASAHVQHASTTRSIHKETINRQAQTRNLWVQQGYARVICPGRQAQCCCRWPPRRAVINVPGAIRANALVSKERLRACIGRVCWLRGLFGFGPRRVH